MAVITSPDTVLAVTVTVGNPEQTDGAYPVLISQITPTGQQVAIEYNGVRIYEGPAAPGSGTEG